MDIYRILVPLWFLVLSGGALAQDCECEEAPGPQGPWSGNFALGYLASDGNTEDTSASLDARVGYDQDQWHHLLAGRAFGATTAEATTSENYKLGWKSSYDFTEFNYAFGSVDWIKDRFSSYPQQTFATAGYGRRILTSEKFTLNLEVGAGYRKQKFRVNEFVTENQDGPVATFGGNFLWNISETASFEQLLTIFASSDNTFTESVSRLRAGLLGNVGLALSYTIRDNSDVGPGLEKTDTYTSISIDYAFGNPGS